MLLNVGNGLGNFTEIADKKTTVDGNFTKDSLLCANAYT